MQLSNLLHIENIICDSHDIISKKQVLEHIGHMVCKQHEACNYVEVLQALLKRERIGSTTLGHGVAIPHARINHLEQPLVCLITLHNPIHFYENNTAAVDIIFSLLVPIDADAAQLAMLDTIKTRLHNTAYCATLRQAHTAQALLTAAIQPFNHKDSNRAQTNSND